MLRLSAVGQERAPLQQDPGHHSTAFSWRSRGAISYSSRSPISTVSRAWKAAERSCSTRFSPAKNSRGLLAANRRDPQAAQEAQQALAELGEAHHRLHGLAVPAGGQQHGDLADSGRRGLQLGGKPGERRAGVLRFLQAQADALLEGRCRGRQAGAGLGGQAAQLLGPRAGGQRGQSRKLAPDFRLAEVAAQAVQEQGVAPLELLRAAGFGRGGEGPRGPQELLQGAQVFQAQLRGVPHGELQPLDLRRRGGGPLLRRGGQQVPARAARLAEHQFGGGEPLLYPPDHLPQGPLVLQAEGQGLIVDPDLQ